MISRRAFILGLAGMLTPVRITLPAARPKPPRGGYSDTYTDTY